MRCLCPVKLCIAAAALPAVCGSGPPEYDASMWKSLITGTSCPAETPLTTKSGALGGTISCTTTATSGRHFRFPEGEFDIDEQVVVPANTVIEGNANPNDPADKAKTPLWATQTLFVATKGVKDHLAAYCGTGSNLHDGEAQQLRVGFLLSSNTTVKNFSFQGRDTVRPWDNGSLCGGAAFETPGCVSSGFAMSGGRDWVGTTGCHDRLGQKNDFLLGDGRGVENVVIDSVRLNDFFKDGQGTQLAVWVAQTHDGSATSNVRVTNLVSMFTKADGINFHGNVQNSIVEDSHIENTGDDIFAVWGGYAASPAGIVFRNNVGKNAGVTRSYNYGVCIAVYGAMDVTFRDTKCYDPPKSHNKCFGGRKNCNSCMAYVHDGSFGAVYPDGNSMKFISNEYLDLHDGSPITNRPHIRHSIFSRAVIEDARSAEVILP